jgi:Fe-S-cluster containining protein
MLDGIIRRRSERFYKHGIRFECQGSGKCCEARGGYGYVYVNLGDRKRLASHLGISTPEFTRRYAEVTDGLFHLKGPEADCLFLEEGRCSVYRARPHQCRTWPFWHENMKEGVWKKEVARYCPGVGKGRLYTAEEIECILEDGREVQGFK